MKSMNAMKAKIHIAKSQLAMDDVSYRALLHRVTGKTSCRALDIRGLQAVIDEMCRLGFKPQSRHGRKPRVPKERQRILDKIEAILTDQQLSWQYANGMAMRMFRRAQVQWLTQEELYKLMQALTIYQQRRRKRDAHH